jgi:hypothetical protein
MNEEVVLNPPEKNNLDEEVPEEQIQMPTPHWSALRT